MLAIPLPRSSRLLVVLALALSGGAVALPAAGAGDAGERTVTCFGKTPTRWGTSADETIYGTQGNDVIVGLGGNDQIWGRGGDDLICGNEGHDFLFGGSGTDRLQGGTGNDILYGEGGRDLLQGGAGGNILNGGLHTDRCLGGDAYVSCELPSVDKILAQCPTVREIAAVDAEFDLVFDADPTAGTFACWPGQGSAWLTPLQKRAYNAVRIMGRIPFDAALPWTPSTLEDWFAQSVHTIRFRSDIAYSSYGPEGVINIQTGTSILDMPAGQATDQWIQHGGVVGLADLMILMAHEARHAQLPHNCSWVDGIGNTMDTNLAYQGAWGVQYYLHRWLAEHTSQAFLAGPPGDRGFYQARHTLNAADVLNYRFCNEP